MTDWSKVANTLSNWHHNDTDTKFDALDAAINLCERMARGELVEAPKCAHDPARKHYTASFCDACAGLQPSAPADQSEREHCERVAKEWSDLCEDIKCSWELEQRHGLNAPHIILRERADAARMAKSECEAELANLREELKTAERVGVMEGIFHIDECAYYTREVRLQERLAARADDREQDE